MAGGAGVNTFREYQQQKHSKAMAHIAATSEKVEKSKAKPSNTDNGNLILDPADPLPTAREFVARKHSTPRGLRTLHRHRGEWLAWNGSSYPTRDDASVRADNFAFLEAAHRVDKNGMTVPFKPTSPKVDNAIDALKAVTHLSSDVEPPEWLGDATGRPDPSECIAAANGILHLPTEQLLEPTPMFLNRNAVAFNYDADAPEPDAWHSFLNDLWPDDKEAIETLQEIFGYLLTTDTRQEKIFLLIGPKRSGKGTIGRVLTALLGRANVCGPTLSGLSGQFGLQPLIGKQLALISDARLSGRTDQAIIAERLLSISGEDTLSVPRKHKQDWTGQLPTRFLILTNELPRLADSSGALASRFIVLTLTRSFYGHEDHELTDRLLGELPGILNWAIAGWQRLNNRGRFVQPDSSQDAIAELEDLGSPVGTFIAERCVVDARRSVECGDLYRNWCEWCTQQGRDHAGTAQTFARDLKAAAPSVTATNPRRTGHSRLRFFEGIGLRGPDDE